MTQTMIEIAKEKDNGTFAKTGMRWAVSQYFNIDMNAPCVTEIVDTYLECIDNISFDKYLYGLHSGGRPVILTRKTLQKNYRDLLQVSDDLDTIVDLFMYLYDEEFYIDVISDCIFSTNLKELIGRQKLNFTGIAMEYERLCLLHEKELLTWEDIDSIVVILKAYGYDIDKDYKYRTADIYETASNIEERLNQIFGL